MRTAFRRQRLSRMRGRLGVRLRDRLGVRLRDDRGSLTAAVVLWTPVVLLLTAFVVDTGFLISQRDRAADLAEQAARRVADDLNVTALRQDPPSYKVNTDTDGQHCLTDATDYLNASGVDPATTVVSDCVVVVGADPAQPADVTVNVTVHLSYRPLFAGIVMSGAVTVTGKGTAHPVIG
jgi:Flp pilus assembly protein TadG